MHKLLCTYLNKILNVLQIHPYIFSLFLKPKFFKWACSTNPDILGHTCKNQRMATLRHGTLKHMTRTMEQPGSMARKAYTYNGGLLHGII